MACVLVVLLIMTLLPELSGGKAYAASSYIISTVAGTGVDMECRETGERQRFRLRPIVPSPTKIFRRYI
jgi:hypothetical protein